MVTVTRRELMRRPSRAAVVLGAVAMCALSGVVWFVVNPATDGAQRGRRKSDDAERKQLAAIPFDGAQAYAYLKQICAIGPRISGTAGMQKQQQLVEEHFKQLGGQVSYQKLTMRHPLDGSQVPLANMIVQWHPKAQNRILLCAHYDTRPYPDKDPNPRLRKAPFVGANDGASGVALLMELGRHMPKLQSNYGVDFVLFDAEELVYSDGVGGLGGDDYFIGSTHFAQQYRRNPPEGYRYRWGVVLDMVADAELQIYQEVHSISWRDTKPLVKEIWTVARQLGVREFIGQPGHTIRDDHLPLHNIARIPTCNIIDFDYPRPGFRQPNYWHTTHDVPENCSALSLAKVGYVMLRWLETTK
jgi:hypothetical protein